MSDVNKGDRKTTHEFKIGLIRVYATALRTPTTWCDPIKSIAKPISLVLIFYIL